MMDPDLTSVLNTLSALSGVPAQAAPTPTPTPGTATGTAPTPAQSESQPQSQPQSQPASTAGTRPTTGTTAGTTAGTAATTATTATTAAEITTWPPALRYITTKAQNPAFHARLKQLIASQRAHERKWWQGREAVAKRLQEREGRRGEVEGVLYVFLSLD